MTPFIIIKIPYCVFWNFLEKKKGVWLSRSLSETFFRTTFAIAVKTLRIWCFGKLVLLAEARLGELFNQIPKQTTNNPNGNNQFRSNSSREEIDLDESDDEEEPPPKPKLEVAKEMGFNKNQVSQFQTLADIQKPYKTLSQNLQKPAFLSGVFFYRRFSEKLKKTASVIIAYPKAGLNIPMPRFISGGASCAFISPV